MSNRYSRPDKPVSGTHLNICSFQMLILDTFISILFDGHKVNLNNP